MGYALSLNGNASDQDSKRVAELTDKFVADLAALANEGPDGNLTFYLRNGTHSVAVTRTDQAARPFATEGHPLATLASGGTGDEQAAGATPAGEANPTAAATASAGDTTNTQDASGAKAAPDANAAQSSAPSPDAGGTA